MEEVSLKEILDYFKSKWLIIILMVILVLALGTLYQVYIQVPKYKSATTLVLNKVSEKDGSITQSDVLLNKNLIPTYREIIKSRTILNGVIKNLELNYEFNELSKMIEVSSVTNTELIKITVASENKKEADDIANELATVFKERIVEIYNIENVSIIDIAEETDIPYNINFIKYTLIFGLFGLVMGLGIVFMMYYFDNTIKDEKTIEEKYGVAVLGIVPLEVKGDGK